MRRARSHAPSSVYGLDLPLLPALSKIYIQVPRKALTTGCLARANDPTLAIGNARLIYSLKGLQAPKPITGGNFQKLKKQTTSLYFVRNNAIMMTIGLSKANRTGTIFVASQIQEKFVARTKITHVR